MNISDILELHYITYIENVPSIIQRGILSHTKARNIAIRDISDSGVQERRKKKKIPGINKKLHDYVNLYFDAHNPMLSKRRSENNDICVLRVNKAVLDIQGVIITDKNAARDCWFKSVDEGLPLLNKDEVYATFWIYHDDPIREYKHAGIKCAEILVPNCVPSSYISGAYVANSIALNKLCAISNLNVIIRRELFFRIEGLV